MLHHNSCLDDPLIFSHHNSENAYSTLPQLRMSCDAASSRATVCDSDLVISTPAHPESSVTVGSTLGTCSPGADLHVMSRQDESPLSSRQPRMIFSSSAAAADHERGFAAASGWSPRCYACSFCGREFNSAQALGGHMNIHRRDRARLRTSASLASVPHQADLPPIPQLNTHQSAHSNLCHPFDAAFRENPTSIGSSLDTYPAPTMISAARPLRLLDMHPAADPALLALAAHPSYDKNSAASFTVPLMDLGPFCSGSTRSSATRLSKIQNESHSLFPNTAPHASPLRIRPDLSLKPVEEPGQASTQQVHLDCSGIKGADGAQLIQFSQSKGRIKRARGNALDAVTISSEVKSTVQRCDEGSSNSISSVEKDSSQHTAASPRSCGRPHSNIKELICLDLELRLGQSSPSDSRASTAGNCCAVGTTARLPP